MATRTPSVDDIRQFLSATFSLPATELKDDSPLFSSGRLDSFHLIEMLGGLESTYGVKVSPGEVSLENLDTPQRMAEFLLRKIGSKK